MSKTAELLQDWCRTDGGCDMYEEEIDLSGFFVVGHVDESVFMASWYDFASNPPSGMTAVLKSQPAHKYVIARNATEEDDSDVIFEFHDTRINDECEPCTMALAEETEEEAPPWQCRVCGCTNEDCTQCIEKTGKPCYWVEPNLCSACR